MKKKILITGATSGIGFNFFKKNFKKNFEFYLVGRNFSNVKSFLKNKKNKKKINLINFDFKNKMRSFNFKKIPKLDYVVLAAGIANNNLIKNFDEKIFDEILNINLIQTAKFIAFLVKKNKINKKASIVAVSSINGNQMSFKYHYAYGISKAGIVAMIKTLANELSSKLIRVNAVSPGMVNTPLTKNLDTNTDYFSDIDKKKYLLGNRYAHPEEITNLINYLLSSKSSFITGQSIIIDGGFTLSK